MATNYRLEGTVPAIPSQLQLFSALKTPTGVDRIFWIEHNSLTQISGSNSNIEFMISPNGSLYTDLKRTRLHLKIKITKADGSNIAAGAHVGLINNALSSLFSQIDIYLQQKLVSSVPYYPYQAYLHNLLNYGGDANNSQLQLQLFYKDTAGRFDSAVISGGQINGGFLSRSVFTAASSIVDLEGPIFASICTLDKYILNGVEIKIKIMQTTNNFRLMSSTPEEYKVEIIDATLKACRVAVSPSTIAGHDLALSKTPAVYNYTKTEMKTYTIAKGSYNFNIEEIFNGDIPSRLIVGFVSSEAFNGSYKLSPFNFKHYNVSFLSTSINGQTVPSKPLQPHFDPVVSEGINLFLGNYGEAYQTVLSGLDKLNRDQGLVFSRLEYPRGYCIYIFDLDGAISSDGDYPVIRKGSLKFECKFKDALPETVNLIMLGDFGGIVEIDQARNVLT
jgi:hypothetical protein